MTMKYGYYTDALIYLFRRRLTSTDASRRPSNQRAFELELNGLVLRSTQI